MKIIRNPQQLRNGILDLRGCDIEDLDVSGMDEISRIILPSGVKRVNASNCRYLETLIVPPGVEEVDVSGCPNLGRGLVMLGLVKRLVLLDSARLAASLLAPKETRSHALNPCEEELIGRGRGCQDFRESCGQACLRKFLPGGAVATGSDRDHSSITSPSIPDAASALCSDTSTELPPAYKAGRFHEEEVIGCFEGIHPQLSAI